MNPNKCGLCEATQVQTHKCTCFGELIKPHKLLSNLDLDSPSSVEPRSQTQEN